MLLMTKKSLVLVAAASLVAMLGAGCSGSKGGSQQQASNGTANISVNLANAQQATHIARMTLTIGPGTGTPSFTTFSSDMTKQDLTGALVWSDFVAAIPAGAGRTFHIDAFDANNNVIYKGDATSNITVGATANIYMVLQGPNDGGFANDLPQIDSLTASSNNVVPGTSVTLSVTAHSPDAEALTYNWSIPSGCGTIGNPNNVPSITWTAPASITTDPTTCQIQIQVQDTKGGEVTAYLSLTIHNPNQGNAYVTAYPNSWPVVSIIYANQTFTKDGTGQIVAIDYDVQANASDPDGDDITYTWTSPNCVGLPGTGFTSSLITTRSTTLVYGPGQFANSIVHFRSADPSHGCLIQLNVTDSWKNGIVPAGSGLPVARGGNTVASVNSSKPTDFILAPQLGTYNVPAQDSSGHVPVQAGQVISITQFATDPTPSFNTAQTPFVFTWTSTGAGITIVDGGSNTTPGNPPYWDKVNITIPSPLPTGMSVTVTVKNVSGLSATRTWTLVPANPCDGSAGSIGLACNTGLGLCAPNGTCTAQGTCVDPNAVVCSALDQCHNVGVCDPSSGVCTNPPKLDGTTCNDHNGCTGGNGGTVDICTGGICGGPDVVCSQSATICQVTTGTCSSTGDTTHTCTFAPQNSGMACTDNPNKCADASDAYTAYACNTAGSCVGTTTTSCVSNACVTGASCVNNVGCSGGTNSPPGTACTGPNSCFSYACNGQGSCAQTTSVCQPGQNCASGTPPVCTDTQLALLADVNQQGVSDQQGVALDLNGNAYVTSFFAGTITVSGTQLVSAGASDLMVAKYGPNSGTTPGAPLWVKSYGDASEQTPATSQHSIAATLDGTAVVVGGFTGTVVPGASNPNSYKIDFLIGFNGTNGAVAWSKVVNNGVNGRFFAVAANPALNLVAVCGHASQASDFVPGATFAGGQDDIVIGMFNSAGTFQWARQIGGAQEEECDSIAIDDVGNLYAAGKYDGTLNFCTGANGDCVGSALPNPNSSFRKWLWLAKFNGTTGAAMAQTSFGSGAGSHLVKGLAVTPTGVALAGSYSNSLPIGTTTLGPAVGSSDAFVARVDFTGGTFVPKWAVAEGSAGVDEFRGIGVDSYGNYAVTGIVSGPSTGMAALNPPGTGAAMVLFSLNGGTGAVSSSAIYGNTLGTAVAGDGVALNREATGSLQNQVVITGDYAQSVTFPAPVGMLTAPGSAAFVIWAPLL